MRSAAARGQFVDGGRGGDVGLLHRLPPLQLGLVELGRGDVAAGIGRRATTARAPAHVP
ncbi:MAG: hypothetical protein ACRD03_06700 [Acidimicrobiales bacterium]